VLPLLSRTVAFSSSLIDPASSGDRHKVVTSASTRRLAVSPALISTTDAPGFPGRQQRQEAALPGYPARPASSLAIAAMTCAMSA